MCGRHGLGPEAHRDPVGVPEIDARHHAPARLRDTPVMRDEALDARLEVLASDQDQRAVLQHETP